MDVRTGAALAFRLLGIMMFACSAGDVSASTHEDAAPPCPAAAWAMADGTTLDIAPGDHGTLRWRRPDADIQVLDRLGHLPMMEDPLAVAQRYRPFLERHRWMTRCA